MPAARNKKSKSKRGQKPASWDIIGKLASEDYRPHRRGALVAIVVSVIGIAALLGLRRVESHVHRLTHFERIELWIDWEDLPPFLQKPDYAVILRRLEHTIALTANDRVLDDSLARRIATSLSNPELGWIEHVERVIVRPNGRISLKCDFRIPRAFVAWAEHYYLVDENGVRLPGEYSYEECANTEWLVIRGVEASNPRVGELWGGPDLIAGLNLARILEQQMFRHQVESINVENFEGRITKTQPHLVIATDRPGSRIWWGRAPDHELGVENSAQQKLALLQRLYNRYGRIDINQPYIDIRSYRDSVAIPSPTRSVPN